jgi:hypothetical protein
LKSFWGWVVILLGVLEILIVVRYTWKSTKEGTSAWERIFAVLTAISDPAGIMLGLLIILSGILTIII